MSGMRYSFESGSVSGWASYPPSQDTAFDPSLFVGRDEAVPMRRPALTRAIRPNRRGLLEIGLIRKLNVVAGDAARIALTWYLKSPAPAASIRFVLCAADGRQYAVETTNPARNRWSTLNLPARRFMSGRKRLPSDSTIEAVYLMATFPDADVDTTVKLFLDAAEITGCRALAQAPLPRIRFQGPSTHPRIFFTRKDLPRLRERAASTQYRGLWKSIEARAKKLREEVRLDRYPDIADFDRRHLLPTFATYAEMLTTAAELVGVNAFVFGITGDRTAGAAAKSALLEMCRWKTFTHPWIRANGMHTYWPVGVASSELAMGYDMLYPLLTRRERAEVREALLNKIVIPAYKEYVVDDRVPYNTSNWIGIITGGALTCAGAIYGETKNAAALRRMIAGLVGKMRRHIDATFTVDGGYGEGLSYEYFDLTHMTRGLAVLKNLFGLDLVASTTLKSCLWHPIYVQRMENNLALSFGDSRENAPETSGAAAIAWLADRIGNPCFHDYYRRLVGERIEGSESSNLSRFVFLYPPREESLLPPDDLPRGWSFPTLGNAIFRSGWRANDIVAAFKCGPYYNHHHLDQGTFSIAGFGEMLLAEGGFTDYYEDPHYQSYFIQPAAHNVLMVDGDPESQRTGDYAGQEKALNLRCAIEASPRGAEYCHVRGILHPVYRGRLRRYTREILHIRPGCFLIRDLVETRGGPRDLRLRFHAPFKKSIENGNEYSVFRGARGALMVASFADRPPRTRVIDVPTPQWEFQKNTSEMRVITRIMGKDAAAPVRPARPRGCLEIAIGGPVRSADMLTLLIADRVETDFARLRRALRVARERHGWNIVVHHGGSRWSITWGDGSPVVAKRS